ncbi:MAG: 50S ribosomal protein L18 [bacterium]
MANKQKLKAKSRARRKLRISGKIRGTAERPRLTVYRSLKHIYAQLVDDSSGKTLTGVSSLSPDLKALGKESNGKGKTELGRLIGKEIAKKAQKLKIKNAVFDRNGFIYHGRVKAVAEGAREGGLKI